jgi:hypothetical protein
MVSEYKKVFTLPAILCPLSKSFFTLCISEHHILGERPINMNLIAMNESGTECYSS